METVPASQNSNENKLAYLKELMQQEPSASMNRIGKMIRVRFGTALSFPVLRQHFVAAGGKVDERRGNRNRNRGPRKSKAVKAPKGARGGKHGPRANTQAKTDYLVEIVRMNPEISMNEASKVLAKRFGTLMAFNNLRKAFIDAGGKVGKPGRKPNPRKEHVARKQGRRSSDVSAAKTRSTLKGMPQHVVIVHVAGDIVPHEFSSRDQAEGFARSQIEAGVASSDLGYYSRQALNISVAI